MPTSNVELTSGFITWDGVKVTNITSVDLVADELAADELDANPIVSINNNADLTFEFDLIYPQKYKKKTLRFYRSYLGIDLLEKKFPKKKKRRSKRMRRKMKEWKIITW